MLTIALLSMSCLFQIIPWFLGSAITRWKYLSLALLGGETPAAGGDAPARLADCLTGLASPKIKQVFFKCTHASEFKARISDMPQKERPPLLPLCV